MKIIFQTLLIVIAIFVGSILFFDLDKVETSNLLEDEKDIIVELSTVTEIEAISNKNKLSIPNDSIFQLMGKSSSQLVEALGEPNRIDVTYYDYDWWIYSISETEYYQFGVKDETICTIYAIGSKAKVGPFTIGQGIQNLFEQVPILPEIIVDNEYGQYRFEMAENQYYEQPLIYLGPYYAQIYIDKFSEEISSIRVLNDKTLIMQRPYELTFIGPLFNPEKKTDVQIQLINDGLINQIFDITNIIRQKNDIGRLTWDSKLASVAFQHSKDMNENNHFSHVSLQTGELRDRLNKEGVVYTIAGENIAAHYLDAIEVVEGWLNSKGHRSTLLNEAFTHLGVGVFDFYYTQNFIGRWEMEEDAE